ncbi:MAG: pirin family protein [Verrucomicrobiota bacterium]
MIQIRKSNERGAADHGWLNARHTFSFADYYDPQHQNFRALRVINEDQVAPEMGFGMHPHRDMEIITYVIEGALRHRDSMGNTAVMRRGDVQRISAGKGIQHSEINDSTIDPVHLLQIWITPDHKNATPAYSEKSFASSERGKLHLVASKSGKEGSISINQDVNLYLGKLEAGNLFRQQLAPGRHAWIQVVQGNLLVNGETLQAGDALSASEVDLLEISAQNESDFLFFDLN